MFCEVYFFDLPYHLDRAFDYLAIDGVKLGSLVFVPFGRGNIKRLGVVMGIKETSDTDQSKIKPVHSVVLSDFALTENMHGLCLFLKEHTLCTVGEAVKAILPPGALHGENMRLRTLLSLAISDTEARELLSKEGRGGIRSRGQREVLTFLIGKGECDRETVRALPNVSSANITALVEKGLVKIGYAESIRNPYLAYGAERDTSEIILSTAQLKAFSKIEELYRSERAECALLHGVTGSGKTKVIMRAIDLAHSEGRRVIMMVPEIALTPQTLGIFCKRYGEGVAVIHSGLSQGERQDAYRRIRRGEVNLVIGTRSAVLCPIDNVGLIVIDEEHEHTYKSESDPKYHAREVASYICGRERGLLLLASATPSLESYRKAKEGRYTYIPLNERYGGVSLPDAVIVDMREELRLGNTSPISARLLESLEGVYDREEQAILFLNRRGYNSTVICKSCGEVLSCKRCSVSLTHHVSAEGGKLMCHMCGYTSPVVKKCPVCGEEKLSFLGFGTQKLESEVGKYLPRVRLMRMDADTTQGKLAYDRLLEGFRRGEADVLLGTQMVAKGHDFPKVTLVGVALADSSLHTGDFRANERTFALLTQVIGRAGRAASGGLAVIQTYSPKHEIIRLACLQDYNTFADGELKLRRELALPPFCDIVTLTQTSESEGELLSEAGRLCTRLKELLSGEIGKYPFTVFGPFEASVYRVNEKYRMKTLIKCRLNREVRAMLSSLLFEFSRTSDRVTLSVDINPNGV
ncbi:MAG: primosomal protein N' [Clostridia bacterium]|nr:primosomal protein N' [Clostridia bacterium]